MGAHASASTTRLISDAAMNATREFDAADRASGTRGVFSNLFARRERSGLPQLSRSKYSRGRNLLDRLDYVAIRSKLEQNTGDRGDPGLAEIYRIQGFDGPPTLTDARGVDEVIAAGGQELFRGVTEVRYVHDFKYEAHTSGSPHQRLATGNGTYATDLRESALDYADNNPDGVIRMALRPDAKIAHIDRLRKEQLAATGAISAENRRLAELERTPETEARMQELRAAWWVHADLGRFAAAQGYDAYSTNGANWKMGDQYWVVLNRTALAVER
ncbi:hypothetical protein AB0M34_24030 [Nocardia sp. NPDC050193]